MAIVFLDFRVGENEQFGQVRCDSQKLFIGAHQIGGNLENSPLFVAVDKFFMVPRVCRFRNSWRKVLHGGNE